VTEPKTPTLLYYLATDYLLFDFVTDYARQHKSIPPAEEFEVTDADFEAFKACAKEKNFTYDRRSEKTLASLKEIARSEGYVEDGDSTLFKSLEARFVPNIERDFERLKQPIKELLASEIVKRYYYEKGELIQSLKNDTVLNKALDLLSHPQQIANALTPPLPAAQ